MPRKDSRHGGWQGPSPDGDSFNGDPSGGYTGNNVCGYNLDGDYDNNMSVH